MLAKGDIMDSCPKLKTIIGSVKLIAARVRTKALLISNVSGRKENIREKKFCV
jgi:hypothetical protein